ncbi:unnamed protein product [Diatraea saccharalis]|uniref:Uncharacterized protein n=1 Tax=Diatraea saccharalis TaxID=40085 RepID=A0A9N9QWE0_9NEOP|nr:unnamed protein product [Diatraea saccharalis]
MPVPRARDTLPRGPPGKHNQLFIRIMIAECKGKGLSAKCDCQHGTCGNHCQRCCSGERWLPHEPCSGNGGTPECSCEERGTCAYDDTGAILCVNCTENRAGPLCDRCLSGFYSDVPDGPCLPCDCDPEGSDGSCQWDRRQHDILCTCYPGFTGQSCDACENPNAVFPNCQDVTSAPDLTCKCNPGGIVDPTRVCDDVCECKANVLGERCDVCADGYFWSGSGCTRCYCSHHAHSCLPADHTPPPPDIILPMGEAWKVTDSMGNETVEPSIDDQGNPFLISYEVEGWELYYWVSSAWSGEQLEWYGGQVSAALGWGVVRGDTGGSPTQGPDFILQAHDGTKLAFGNTSHEQPGQLTLTAPLLEDSWYSLEEPGLPITRTQLMDVLANLKALMLRAHFHFDQDEVRIEWVKVHSRGVEVVTEQCACGVGYAGRHCQHCAWHHLSHAGQCLPCPCHQHATCTTVDGPCGECQHNTTGPHCERCLPGHYGNPVQGDCKPCACPLYLPSNNFSPNCALASAEGDEFVCTQCPDGYAGDHCENCDFGYWGSPSTPGGRCQPCACGGSPCHPRTGACRTCPPHAEGARCDQCEDGLGVVCVACACGGGALAGACDARSGLCACRPGWTGRACDQCAAGHGGIAAGCPACHCGVAARSSECDPVTGECACAPGAAPPSCDTCLDEHYSLNATGCTGNGDWLVVSHALVSVGDGRCGGGCVGCQFAAAMRWTCSAGTAQGGREGARQEILSAVLRARMRAEEASLTTRKAIPAVPQDVVRTQIWYVLRFNVAL